MSRTHLAEMTRFAGKLTVLLDTLLEACCHVEIEWEATADDTVRLDWDVPEFFRSDRTPLVKPDEPDDADDEADAKIEGKRARRKAREAAKAAKAEAARLKAQRDKEEVDLAVEMLIHVIDEHKSRIQNLVHMMDRDRDGRLSVIELWRGLQRLGVNVMPRYVKLLVDRIDQSRDGHVSLLELKQCIAEGRNMLLQRGQRRGSVEAAFRQERQAAAARS